MTVRLRSIPMIVLALLALVGTASASHSSNHDQYGPCSPDTACVEEKRTDDPNCSRSTSAGNLTLVGVEKFGHIGLSGGHTCANNTGWDRHSTSGLHSRIFIGAAAPFYLDVYVWWRESSHQYVWQPSPTNTTEIGSAGEVGVENAEEFPDVKYRFEWVEQHSPTERCDTHLESSERVVEDLARMVIQSCPIGPPPPPPDRPWGSLFVCPEGFAPTGEAGADAAICFALAETPRALSDAHEYTAWAATRAWSLLS